MHNVREKHKKSAIVSTWERFVTKHGREKGINISWGEITGKHRVSPCAHRVHGTPLDLDLDAPMAGTPAPRVCGNVEPTAAPTATEDLPTGVLQR